MVIEVLNRISVMRIFIIVLQWIVFILILFHLLFWGALYASGHGAPAETEKEIICSILILLVIQVVFYFWKKHLVKKDLSNQNER